MIDFGLREDLVVELTRAFAERELQRRRDHERRGLRDAIRGAAGSARLGERKALR